MMMMMMKDVVGRGGWMVTHHTSWKKKKSAQQTALRFPSFPLCRCLMKSARPRIIVIFIYFPFFSSQLELSLDPGLCGGTQTPTLNTDGNLLPNEKQTLSLLVA